MYSALCFVLNRINRKSYLGPGKRREDILTIEIENTQILNGDDDDICFLYLLLIFADSYCILNIELKRDIIRVQI
jgi:hypothetical protein